MKKRKGNGNFSKREVSLLLAKRDPIFCVSSIKKERSLKRKKADL